MKKNSSVKNVSISIFLIAFGIVSAWLSVVQAQTSVDVKKSVNVVVLKDSDGDGILDSEDEHPEIPEIYIVQDDNSNGIVDSIE